MRHIVIIGLLFITACSENSFTDRVPKKYIQPNEMRFIMWDMLKADEYYNRIIMYDSAHKLQNENFRLYDQVFRSYGITKEQYYSSFKFYESHPKLFKALVDSVDATSRISKDKALK